MRKMIKKLLILFMVGLTIFSCCSCGNNISKKAFKNDEEDNAESLSIFSYKPDTFCPIASNNQANVSMLGVVYDGLISLNDKNVAIPNLAESWKSSDNAALWTLTLQDNVSWHDGTYLTSADVVYTINQIKKLENSVYHYNVSNIEMVDATGEKTIKFKLFKPSSNFISLLYFPIIKSGAEDIDLANYKPVGTGPYKFEDRNEGNVYYLVKNEKWWGGEVKTNTIQVKMLPGGDTALYAFGSGSIDLVPADNMDWGKFVDPLETSYAPIKTPVYNFLGINHKSSVLSKSEVRQAISLAIDRDEIVEESRLGYGVAVNTPMRPEWFLSENQSAELKKDTEAAKKLLEESDWKLKDNSYHKTEGGVELRTEFTILINEENTVKENIARIIQSNLEEFGIKTDIQRVSYEEYTKRISEGNFDTFVGSMIISPDLDFSTFLGDENIYSFSDEEMNFVMQEMNKKMGEDAIKAAYAEFINLFEQLNPVIGLFFEDSVMLYSKKITSKVEPAYFDIYRGLESLVKAAS